MKDIEQQIRKYEDWMHTVRNAENYSDLEDDFLDELVHGNDSNSRSFISSLGAYLAVYEDDGEVKVEDDLLEELDRRLTEKARNGSNEPSRVKERTKHRDIVYGRGKREEKGLLDRGFNGHDSGHAFLEEMIDDFRDATSIQSERKSRTPPAITDGRGPDENDTTSKPENQQNNNGGEPNMDYEGEDSFGNLLERMKGTENKLEEAVEYINGEEYDSAETAIKEVARTLGEDHDEVRETVRAIAQWTRGTGSELEDLYQDIESRKSTLEDIAESLESTGFRGDERESMSEIQQYVFGSDSEE